MAFADAPVSGGTNGAEAGTLTVMVGADAATFERARPVLEAFGRRIEHVGPVGAGDALKAVNNALLAVNILAVGEGLAALVKAGVAPRTRARRAQRLERAVLRQRGAGARAGAHGSLAAHVPAGAAREGRRRSPRDLLAETGVAGPIFELAARRCLPARGRRWARRPTTSIPSG